MAGGQKHGDMAVLKALVAALRDKSHWVRCRAHNALVELADERCTGPLIEVLLLP